MPSHNRQQYSPFVWFRTSFDDGHYCVRVEKSSFRNRELPGQPGKQKFPSKMLDNSVMSLLTAESFTENKKYYSVLTLILRRSRTGTVWFYTSTSNKRAARPKLYTKSLTRDLKLMYSRFFPLTFRHRASSIQGQAFHYSSENAFYIFNQQIYFII